MSALDTAAVQRARARQQYSTMARMKVTAGTASLRKFWTLRIKYNVYNKYKSIAQFKRKEQFFSESLYERFCMSHDFYDSFTIDKRYKFCAFGKIEAPVKVHNFSM